MFRIVRNVSRLARSFGELPKPGWGDLEDVHNLFCELDAYSGGPDTVEPRKPLPELDLHLVSYNPETKDYETSIINTKTYYEEKRVIFLGILGAFVPECTCEVVYEWARASEVFKERFELDDVTVITQNDPFVVTHFARKLGYEHRLNFIADWNGKLNEPMRCQKELGMELGLRNHRYNAFILYGKLQIVISSHISELFFTKCIHPIFMWQNMNDPTQNPLYFC